MADNSTPQWNPVQEFRESWPNSGLSDQQIVTNLQDPAKFRSAFPHYTDATDDMIRSHMRAYLPASTAAPQTPTSNGSDVPGAGTRFLKNFNENVGAPERPLDVVSGPAYMLQHPIDSAELLGGGIADSMRKTIAQGQARVAAGDKLGGYYEEALGHLPVVGPGLASAGEQAVSGDYAGALGSTLGMAAGLFGIDKLTPHPVEPLRIEAGTLDRAQAAREVPAEPPAATPQAAPVEAKPVGAVLTDARRAEISRLAQQTSASKQQPPSIVPEPTEALTPDHTQVAEAIEERHQSAPEQTVAPEATPSAPVPPPAESPTEPFQPQVTASLQDSFANLVRYKRAIESATSDEERQTITGQYALELNRAQDVLNRQLNNGSPEQLAALRDHVNAVAEQNTAQAQGIRDVVAQHEAVKDNVAAIRQAMSTGGPVRNVVNPDTGERALMKPDAEVKRGPRDLLHELMGEKPFTTAEQLTPRPKPANVSDEAWNGLMGKLNNQRMALRGEIARDAEILRDTKLPYEESDLPDKLKKLSDVENMIGTYPSAKGVSGRRAKMPVAVGDQGEVKVQAPLQTISKAMADQIFGRNLRKIPEIGEFNKLADDKEEIARLHKGIASAIDQRIGLQPAPRNAEAGSAPLETMAGAAIGAAIGHHIGGTEGAIAGGTLGAVTPALLRSAPVQRSFRAVSPILKSIGVTARNWFTPPRDPAISPEMQKIRDAQALSLKAPEQTLAARITQIPGDLWQKLDPYALVTDRPNPVQQWTMALDPRGQYFRDAKGQFSLGESPYVAVRTAVSGIRGAVGEARMMYKDIEVDARKAGLHEDTTEYLNLKGYQRVYQVLQENASGLLNDVQQSRQKLAASNNVREQIQLEDHIDKSKKALLSIRDKIVNGTAVPGGYDSTRITKDLSAIEQKVGPAAWQQIQSFGQRVFDANRKALDLIADVQNNFKDGIITPEMYKTFTSRGNEYIPMKRILEVAADANGRFYGKNSPLYLRQQNVIKTLEGSTKFNADPWQASADAHAEAVRENLRNRTLGVFLDAANNDPDIGSYFKRVQQGYRPKKGETVVGKYEGGVQQRYAVPEWLGNSLDTTSLAQSQTALKTVMNGVTKVFKATATTFNPAWAMTVQNTNVAARALLTAEGPVNPKLIAQAFGDAVKGAWTHDDRWMEFAKTGLARGTFMKMLYPESDISPVKLGWKGPVSLKHPIETMQHLSDLPAEVFQMNHFTRLRQAGYTPEEAAFKTQHYGPLPDYAQVGKINSPGPQLFTFLNANWAHLRSDLALATEDKYRGRLMMAALATAIPTLSLALHNVQQTDENGKSLWGRISDAEKDKYWIFLHGGTDPNGRPNITRMVKPDFVRVYFNVMEDMMYKGLNSAYHNGADERSVKQLVANEASRFLPMHPQFDASQMNGIGGTAKELARGIGAATYGELTPAIRVPLEEIFNRRVSFGRISPIVSDSQSKVDSSMQGYGQRDVSPTAMWEGQKLGMSPARIEHVQRGLLGPIARLAERHTDPLLATNPHMPALQGTSGQNSGIINGSSAVNQEELDLQKRFDQNASTLSTTYNTYRMLSHANDPRAADYLRANQNVVWKGELANRLQSRLQTIDSRIRQEEQSTTDPVALKNLHESRVTILRSMNGLLDRVTSK